MSICNAHKPAHNEPPAPPRGLRAAGQGFWRRVHDDFVVEQHLLDILELACRQLDRGNAARRRQFKAESESAIERAECAERAASLAFLKLRRELNLDREPAGPKGPALPGKRY